MSFVPHYRSALPSLLLLATALPGCEAQEAPQVVEAQPLDLIEDLTLASFGSDVVDLDLGTPASRKYLGKGWARNGKGPDRDFVWGLGDSSVLLVNLNQPRHVSITIQARAYGGAGRDDQTVTLFANDEEIGTIELPKGWSESTVVAPSGVFHHGENTIELQYAWSASPSDHTESEDRRELAVAFDLVTINPDSPPPGQPDDQPRAAELDFGTVKSRDSLVDGWGGQEEGPEGTTYAWATTTEPEVVVDLGRPVPSRLTFRARPFRYPDAESQTVQLSLNGTEVGTWNLDEGWHEYAADLDASVLKTGANTVSIELAYAVSPSKVGTGTDPRKLAAAFDLLTITPNESSVREYGGKLHLPLGVRTTFPVKLPANATLDLDMPDQDSQLLVELKDTRARTSQSWLVTESREIQLTDDLQAERIMQLALTARRKGDHTVPVVVHRATVNAPPEGKSPRFIGLRPRSQANEGDPPASP